MKKILFTLVALTVLTLAFASPALASPKSSSNGPSHGSASMSKFVSPNHSSFAKGKSGQSNYHLTNGKKFAHGYLYHGKHHNHWTQRRWDSHYNCECYFDPCCSCWYYWCQPDVCYYPVTYCPYRTYCWTETVVQKVCVQPVCEQPVCEQPVCVQPVCVRPVCVQPVYVRPVCVQPVCVRPVCVQPVCVQPVCVQPACCQ